MLLGARQFFERRGAPTPPLPYDAEVEYLESTGTQWIDSGIIPNPDIGFVLSAAYTGYTAGYGRLFGTQKDGGAAVITVRQSEASGGNIRVEKSGGVGGVAASIPFDSEKHIFRFNYPDNSVSIDGSKWTYTSFSSSFTSSCWLWGNNNVNFGFAKARIYGLLVVSRVTDNDVANFIPVRFTNELGQSEGAMYDRVSGQLFRNAGTGAFIIGPDKTSHTSRDYVQNGLIAMWDGIENAGWGVHDGSATTWVDISGNNRDAVLSGTYSWGSNYWHVESVSGQGLATWPAQNLGNSQTIEIVIHPISMSSYGRIIAEGQSVASPNLDNSNNYIRMYGYGIDQSKKVSDNFDSVALHSHQIVHPSGGPMQYYIDGSLVWEVQTSQDSTGSTYGYFANRSELNRGIDARYYAVRRYNRTLTAAEIAANYAIDKARFNLP